MPTASFSMYPNPSSGNVSLELDAFFDKKVQITVYNHLGQVVKLAQIEQVTMAAQSIDLTALIASTYMVEVVSDTQRITKKLVLAKL